MIARRRIRSKLSGVMFALTLATTAWPAAAAVLTETSCGSAGAGTLRAHITAAASGDTINVPACVITLTGAAGDDANTSGDLDVVGTSNVTLIGMTIRNGHPPNNGSGGGLRVGPSAALTLINNVVVSGNQGDAGGGIQTEGDLTLDHVIVRDNTSFSGGGTFNDGAMTLVNSRIVRNLADSDNLAGGDGGGLFQLSGQLALRRTVLARNLVGSTGSGPDCFINLGP